MGALAEALGDGVAASGCAAAVRAEMAYYREHSHEGRDAESLAELRERCAAVLSRVSSAARSAPRR